MMENRYAFIKANWHSEIVNQALVGFQEIVDERCVQVFDVPGAFEMPLVALDLAKTGNYTAIAAAALVVDGGIYRHDFVAQAVVNGLMQAGLESGIPILSISLTPHHFQESDHHIKIYREHFIKKGQEAGKAALEISKTRKSMGIQRI